MGDQNSNPTFEARRLQSAPGWYVRVSWPHGKSDHIPGFVTQREAEHWIENKARLWASEKSAGVLNLIAGQRRDHHSRQDRTSNSLLKNIFGRTIGQG
jgi:hypothetical protein